MMEGQTIYLVKNKDGQTIYANRDQKLRDNYYDECRKKKQNVTKGEKNLYNEKR